MESTKQIDKKYYTLKGLRDQITDGRLKRFTERVDRKLEEWKRKGEERRQRTLEEVKQRTGRDPLKLSKPNTPIRGIKSETYGGKFNKKF